MDRRRFLTIKEIESYIDTSGSEVEDEEAPSSAKRRKVDQVPSNKIARVVYIPPADVDAVSDEELIDDNELITEVPAMTDVCGELEVEHESGVVDFASPPPCSSETPEAGPSISKKTTKHTAEKDFVIPKWKTTKRVDFEFGPPDEAAVQPLQKNRGKTPFELFLQFFDEEIMEMLVVNTNIYAHQNNIVTDITKQQIYRFIGILILSGYHKVPHVEHYWSTQQTQVYHVVKQALSRYNFQLIKRIFHLMDNNEIESTDRFAKVRPLIDALNHEQMIPYFGRHSCKMFILVIYMQYHHMEDPLYRMIEM
ncbi:piggyBac transposable element-derived protein 3-like [Rhagoletis pomonella]|uniref:piggyBac transposable element-derived protein 3-like n=1 Tax=Rhagoletis pomonella TaxID=28610 RepID=UPI00177AC8D8|nr:piggyBac transposable element-derived protein 3-like [Rhagoletis pomonella]